MALVDPLFAQWLQAEALYAVRTDATLDARWGDSAIVSERISPIALLGDANTEADAQLAFMGGPLVEDVHIVKGQMTTYLGQCIDLTIDELGYDSPVTVFVIAAQDDRATGMSLINVLRRL